MCSRLQFQRRRLRVLQAGSAGPTSQTPNLLRLNVTDPSILHSSPASAGARARPPQVARIQRRHAGGRLRGGAHAGGARSGGVKGRAADLGQKRVCRVGFTHQVIQKPLTFRLMTLTNGRERPTTAGRMRRDASYAVAPPGAALPPEPAASERKCEIRIILYHSVSQSDT